MSIGETIKALRIKKGMTQAELAAAVGVSKYTIIRYETGASFPNFRILQRIEDVFQVQFGYNPDYKTQVSTVLKSQDSFCDIKHKKTAVAKWIIALDENAFIKVEQLLTLAGMYTSKEVQADIQPAKVIDPAERRRSKPKLMIPVVGRSAAGLPMEMVEATDEAVAINGETTAQLGDYAVIAVGDSMIDAGIHDGDRCLIRPREDVENGQIALVAIDSGSTIKKFYKDDDGFRLVPCNPKHEVQHYGPDAPISVLGLFLTVLDPPLD